LAEGWQELGPRLNVGRLADDGGDEDADGGAYQLAGVADALEALALDEGLAPVGKLVEEGLGIVFEDQAAERAGRVICVRRLMIEI